MNQIEQFTHGGKTFAEIDYEKSWFEFRGTKLNAINLFPLDKPPEFREYRLLM